MTVYGASEETYARVTRRPGAYAAFRRGLELLQAASVPVRLKAMLLRSNVHEFAEIIAFCRANTSDYARYDPLLHLRYDGNPQRNAEIRMERLSAEEIIAIEREDQPRVDELAKKCTATDPPPAEYLARHYLFSCGIGNSEFHVSYDGLFRPCSSMWHPACIGNLRDTSLASLWERLIPPVQALTSDAPEFLEKCHACTLRNVCLWCPAHAYLETGQLDAWCEGFCQIAHARAAFAESRCG